jgi:predicted nuclease of predicted toxin-antitoxin system
MKILLDMNLSPSWVAFLESEGFESIHWMSVGSGRESDQILMEWAKENGFVVFTHDLDFSALLAATRAHGPSVIQLRGQNVLPATVGKDVVRVLRMRAPENLQGAIVTIDKVASRVRVLPVGGRQLP